MSEWHTLAEYRAMCKRGWCKWCGTPLPQTVDHFPHAGGWLVQGMNELQWLYIHCPNCEYDHALWKLGVPR